MLTLDAAGREVINISTATTIIQQPLGLQT